MAWLAHSKVRRIDRLMDKFYESIDSGVRYPEVPLVKIVEKRGLEVYQCDFGAHPGNDVMGAIEFKDDGFKPVIYINRYNHPDNQKFTLAHGLGHYMLGHRQPDSQFWIDFESDIYPRDADIKTQELEANYFAGAILMPTKTIKQQLNRADLNQKMTTGEFKKLKAYFGVSELVLKTRITCLRRAKQ